MIEILIQAESALSFGLLDRAETLYRQVAEADPRNAMARVGLARVALEREDETTALAEGRRALAIDPENLAAQRLVERIEEVQRFRGTDLQGLSMPADETPATWQPPSPAEPPAAVVESSPAPRRSLLDRLRRRR